MNGLFAGRRDILEKLRDMTGNHLLLMLSCIRRCISPISPPLYRAIAWAPATYLRDSILQGVLEYAPESAYPPSILHAKQSSHPPPYRQCYLHSQNLGLAKSSRPWRCPKSNRCPQSYKSAGDGKKDSSREILPRLRTWTSQLRKTSLHQGDIPDS